MRSPVFALLLVFAIAALVPAVAAVEAKPAEEPVQASTRQGGDPLKSAAPESWVPVWIATGDLSQAMQAAQESLRLSYNLYPLGDANGDGKEDFLLENHTVRETEDEYSSESWVHAVSGANFASLWSLHVPDNQYWYPLGDVNGDGIEDIVVTKYTNSGAGNRVGANGVSLSRYDYPTHVQYTLVNGVTGASLFSVSCTMSFTITSASAFAAVGYARLQDYKWTSCYLAPIPNGVGVDLHDQSMEFRMAGASGFVAGASARATSMGIKIIRYNADGVRAWEWSMQRDGLSVWQGATADFTGDGVSDILLVTQPAWIGSVYGPFGYKGLRNVQSGEIVLLDGKAGRIAWSHSLSQSEEAMVDVARGLRSPGSWDILLSEFSQPNPAAPYQATLRQINGATGGLLHGKTLTGVIAALVAHDDLDQDGREELILLQSRILSQPLSEPEMDETLEVRVIRADHTEVWGPLKSNWERSWFEPMDGVDLNGDGVDEMVIVEYGSGESEERVYRFHSGATGDVLWEYKASPRVVSLEIVGDIDGTPGDDVAITIFEIPESKLKKSASPSATSGVGGSASPRSQASERINYADYVGRLELRRGTDRELIWEKKVHDPKDVQNVTAHYVWSYLRLIPDTNADATPDLLFNLDTPTFSILLRPDGSFEFLEQEATLQFALLVSGADGKTLRAYPEAKAQAPALIGKAAKGNVPRLQSEDGASVPGASLLVLMVAALAAAVVSARRSGQA